MEILYKPTTKNIFFSIAVFFLFIVAGYFLTIKTDYFADSSFSRILGI